MSCLPFAPPGEKKLATPLLLRHNHGEEINKAHIKKYKIATSDFWGSQLSALISDHSRLILTNEMSNGRAKSQQAVYFRFLHNGTMFQKVQQVRSSVL